ncbi:MAG: transketolase [Candidatus Aenigmatarchaeota archaeon]
MADVNTRFDKELTDPEIQYILHSVKQVRADTIRSTRAADSGHPGGALGSADILFITLFGANISPETPYDFTNNMFLASAAHYAPGIYSSQAQLGLFPIEELDFLRLSGSLLEGHVTHKVPGNWWTTGILGQGLSASMGFAIGKRLLGYDNNYIFVHMGDGEQNKGQIAEALRFGKKYNIKNVIPIVCNNRQQLSNTTESVMPMNISGVYQAAGWNVLEIPNYTDDVERIKQYWKALGDATIGLTALIVNTTMGKGVLEIENSYEYHGKPLPEDLVKKYLEVFGFEAQDLAETRERRAQGFSKTEYQGRPKPNLNINLGEKRLYRREDKDVKNGKIANRDAWQNALMSLAKANMDETGEALEGYSPIAVVDCDLEGSVKTQKFREAYSNNFFQSGIQEHHAGTFAGALSAMPILTFLADFGVLSVDEMYSQHRLTALNEGNLKLVSTHCGLDVGEDGKTHQAEGYLLLDSKYGWTTFTPMDANQTDRIVPYMAQNHGCMHMAVGRSDAFIIYKQNEDTPFFDLDYDFELGKVDELRNYGDDVVIYTYGAMAWRAVEAAEQLNKQGIGAKVLGLSTPMYSNKEAVKSAVTDNTKLVISYEDHFIGSEGHERVGIAPLIKNWLYDTSHHPEVYNLGTREPGTSGKPDDVYRAAGLHQDILVNYISSAMKDLKTSNTGI